MTLLSICAGLAKNVGLSVPTSIVGNPDRNSVEALEFANETGEELARRVDWGALASSTTFTGTGANTTFTMPAGFSRLSAGVAIKSPSIVRPVTRAEFNSLTPSVGTPRYFLLQGTTLSLWPYLANAATVTALYQSKLWVAGASAFTADSQSPVFDEDLFLKGLIVRWRRQKGMPYQDEEAEYEASLADFARNDERSRF